MYLSEVDVWGWGGGEGDIPCTYICMCLQVGEGMCACLGVCVLFSGEEEEGRESEFFLSRGERSKE